MKLEDRVKLVIDILRADMLESDADAERYANQYVKNGYEERAATCRSTILALKKILAMQDEDDKLSESKKS